MKHDPDESAWGKLADAWRQDDMRTPPPDVQRLLITRRLRRITLLEVLALVVVIAAPLAVFEGLRHHPEYVSVGLSVAVTVHVAAIWGLLLWNRWGTFRRVGESSADYLRAAIRRYRRQRRSLVLLSLLLVIESVAFALYVRQPPGAPGLAAHLFAVGAAGEFLATIAFLVAFTIGLFVSWRWTRMSLGRLEKDLRELESVDPV